MLSHIAPSFLSLAFFFLLYALLGFFCVFLLLFLKLNILNVRDTFFRPKPKDDASSKRETPFVTGDTGSVYHFSSFTSLLAAPFIFIPLLVCIVAPANFVDPDYRFILLVLVCGLASLYLYRLGRATTQRIFFEKGHAYFGTTRADAFCETDYTYMYYLTTPAKAPLTLFEYVHKPTLVVFRKNKRFPLFFCYILDRFFPASNANRQVLFMSTWTLEKGPGKPIIQRGNNKYLFWTGQQGLLKALIKNANDHKLKVSSGRSDWMNVLLVLFFFLVAAIALFIRKNQLGWS